MNFKNGTLEDWLENQNKEHFPKQGIDYKIRYNGIKDYLNENVHNHVTGFASIIDGVYYTDHGPGHIKNAIRRATDLVKAPKIKLTPYEVYLLLVAIHFHDVGHIKNGRENHEIDAAKVMKELDILLGTDNFEKYNIYQIVQAHGGKNTSGNKDKISPLPEETQISGFPIRIQLLAALLKFADELSDDSSRAAEYLAKNKQIPKSSEIFHYFSLSLHTVKVNHNAKIIELHFVLDKNNISVKYGKAQEEVYLLDEIYERTLKTYRECLYCMRFIPSESQIRSVKVKIEFIDKLEELDSDDSWRPFNPPITYNITETGYPDLGEKDIFSLCPKELFHEGDRLTGSKLKELIEKNQKKGGNCV